MSKLRLKKRKQFPPIDAAVSNTGKTENEKQVKRILQRAIYNAEKHNVKLESGRVNHGDGNCSYESVIFNINDRKCFTKLLPMSPDYYRRIWNIDLMNKVLDKRIPWNPGMTRAQIVGGFQELMVSGVYERSFFGDMMMAGIACGVRQIILIFNTNENNPHDPISVVDPRDYAGDIDSEIPVVVAYNLVHYESLHPVGEQDIKETIKLVKSYIAKPSRYRQEYGFTRTDMPYLISRSILPKPSATKPRQTQNPESQTSTSQNESAQSQNPPKTTTKCLQIARNESLDDNQNNYKNEGFKFEDVFFNKISN